ncbi:MAG TPA: hypothetical protein PKI22_08225 [Hydrogenophilus thermoluteolus]|nr:hypothetical protein [Hydrogenophilus thermoluteolus]HNU19041.1 hypothetical protein [Hydrogenophilus thermoluteolus]
MTRHLEWLAEDRPEIERGGLSAARWRWQDLVSYARSNATTPQRLTEERQRFLIQHALALDPKVDLKTALDDPRKAQGEARILEVAGFQELQAAGLYYPAYPLDSFPPGSIEVTLRFCLLTPLLTRDDAAFTLFDNPLRKDAIYGVPYLSAASVKGLAADAFQRGFPPQAPWETLGANDAERTTAYRRRTAQAKRLFGVATDQEGMPSAEGRVRFDPIWFRYVQYLVMNPMKTDGSGIGTQPIHFEAAAAKTPKGDSVSATVRLLYFNPAGTEASDEATACADVAALVEALAAWWPVLGLGAKRLAGYGALRPEGAAYRYRTANSVKQQEFSGDESWQKLAKALAQEGRS